MLIGNLGKDAETRFTTSNMSVTSFTLATTHSYKGKDGNWVNETTWHNISAWSLSDYFKNNLKKGKKFYIEGRIQKRDYTDKDGVKRYSVDVVAEKIIPLEAGANEQGSVSNFREDASPGSMSEPDIQVDENEDLPF
jgi:single-strand DNA-binding protein